MVPPDLLSYLREQSSQGVPAMDLREALMEAGWSEHDVENAFHDVAAGLQPLTQGASLHEDVAQVRGLVAHLATRVQRLEVRLTDTGTMIVPSELPSGEVSPARTLSEISEDSPHKPGMVFRLFLSLLALAAMALFGFYFRTLVANSQRTPLAFLEVSSVAGLVFLLLGGVLMRRRSAFGAELSVACAVAIWAVTVWHAWRAYDLLEAGTAAALGALLVVLPLVMGRWIDRYSQAR